MNKTRKTAVIILIIGAVIISLFASGILVLNITASVPRGIWLQINGPLEAGDFVTLPPEAFKIPEWLPNVYREKILSEGSLNFLKEVGGLPGDLIELGKFSLTSINGVLIPNSAPMSRDSLGNNLKPFALPIKLASDEVWLVSTSPGGFDSRYLGPAKLSKCKRVIPLLTF